MFGRLAKVVSYAKAPRKTFITLHPLKTLKWGAAFLLLKLLFEPKRKTDEKEPRPQEG